MATMKLTDQASEAGQSPDGHPLGGGRGAAQSEPGAQANAGANLGASRPLPPGTVDVQPAARTGPAPAQGGNHSLLRAVESLDNMDEPRRDSPNGQAGAPQSRKQGSPANLSAPSAAPLAKPGAEDPGNSQPRPPTEARPGGSPSAAARNPTQDLAAPRSSQPGGERSTVPAPTGPRPAGAAAASPAPGPNVAVVRPNSPRPVPQQGVPTPKGPSLGVVAAVGPKPAPPASQNPQRPGPPAVAKPLNPPKSASIVGRAGAADQVGLALVPAEILQLEVSGLLRRKRNLFLLRVLLFIALPALLMTAYVFLYATPRYVSRFEAIYHSNELQMQSSGAGALLGLSGSVDMNEAVIAYLQSPAALVDVAKQLDVRKVFSDRRIDWWDRLPADATMETFVSYFQHRVSAYENSAGYVVADIEAFSPTEARDLAAALLSSAENLVAELDQREKLDMVRFTESEVERCEREYSGTVERLTEFREKHRDYDFSGSEQLLTGTVGTLQTQLAALRYQLTSARKFLGENAPTVTVLRNQIVALQSQIAEEQASLASPVSGRPQQADPDASARPSVDAARAERSGGQLSELETATKPPYSELLATYFRLSQDQQFATALLQTAKQAAEAARLDAGKRSAYLFGFVPPNLPERSTEPDALRYILTTIVVCMLVYFAFSVLFGMFHHESGAETKS